MYPYLDNQAFADLLVGRLPAPGVWTEQAGLPRVQFSIPGDSGRDRAAMLESLRRLLPNQAVAEVRVEGISGHLAKGESRTTATGTT